MVRRAGAWDSHVEGLKWTLLAALGVAACSGRSVRHSSEGDDAGDTGTGASGSRGGGKSSGGSGGSAARGGAGAKGGTGPGLDGGSSFGANGGVGAAGGVAGGGGSGAVSGTSGEGGLGGGLGFQPQGCAAASGYAGTVEWCRGDFVHRPAAATCLAPPRSPGNDGEAGGGNEGGAGNAGGNDGAAAAGASFEGDCLDDHDCRGGINGFCVFQQFEGVVRSFCHYACEEDANCSDAQQCSCGESFVDRGTDEVVRLGVCTSASCRTDSECGEGLLCISPLDAECGGAHPTGYHCQSWSDECAGPADCAQDEECAYDGERFSCQGRVVCGRPFIVGDRARLAEAAERSDWADASVRPTLAIDSAACAEIARHWTDAALAEHASVAAFARFTLELMALGAPDDLLEASVSAMADETRHAALCFGLASRYAAAAIGPSELDMTGAFADGDFLAVVDRAIVEGVIGETAAALEAAWARDAAVDEEVRAALAIIAADESRHAALAFRFLAWAVKRDARVLPLVEQRFQQVVRAEEREIDALSPAALGSAERLASHGVLDALTRRAARRAVLVDVLPGVIAALRSAVSPKPGYAWGHGEACRLLG